MIDWTLDPRRRLLDRSLPLPGGFPGGSWLPGRWFGGRSGGGCCVGPCFCLRGSFVKEKKIVDAFLALVRAGLWETEVRLPPGDVDCPELFRLAQEQAVVGLVAAGLEHVPEAAVAKKDALAFVGSALQLEQRNAAMNHFIGGLVERMRAAGIVAVLVKGQGVAQCYERPLWRVCGGMWTCS